MTSNENGFTYPLTLSILIIFLLVFSLQAEQLLTERKMYKETRTILQQEYYMLLSVKKIEKAIQTNGPIQAGGSIQYHYGSIDYLPEAPSVNIQKITFTLHLNTGEATHGYGYYDTNLKKMVKWVEKN